MYSVQVDWRTYYGALIRDNSNKIIPLKDAYEIENPKLKTIISRIDEMIQNSQNEYHSSSSWLFWKHTKPCINFRDLNDGNSASHLSDMNKTIERITKDIIDDIGVIRKEKSNK